MSAARSTRDRWTDAAAVALGTLMTLCVSGYQFGRGNHTVYLLEGLRLTDPTLFRNDWFVTQTLQYHTIFSQLTAVMMRLNLVQPAFLIGYLLIAVLWHVAWLLIARAIGASRLTYLTSVLLYYLSAAGIALGVYQFLQDGCFVPSNVANVAMLWGFYFWITDRRGWSGLLLGISGLFHLNHAVVAIGVWIALSVWDRRSIRRRPVVVGSLLLMLLSGFNIANALHARFHETGGIALDQFVEIYVRFRHAHHFDPLSWPIALWIAFLWPIPVAAWGWVALRRRAADDRQRDALRHAALIFLLLLALQAIAFLFAGVFYVSEALVQLILWRFSIYVKLLSCIGAAWVICEGASKKLRDAMLVALPLLLCAVVALLLTMNGFVSQAIHEHTPAIVLFVVLSFVPAAMTLRWKPPAAFTIVACVLVAVVGWNRWLGFGMTPEQVDDEYLQVCRWARESTPVDSVFLVPPSDTAFRLEARRAIVVNFKHVPHLNPEIVEWERRVKRVLAIDDFSRFPRNYLQLLRSLDDRYESRSAGELFDVASEFGARYVVVEHELGQPYQRLLVYQSNNRLYFVYDRGG